MDLKLKITKVPKGIDHPAAWEWVYTQGRKFIAGGYCATKKAAASDAAIWFKAREKDGTL